MTFVRSLCLLLLVATLPAVSVAVAQDSQSEAQQKIKQLEFLLGDWDVTGQDGRVSAMTYRFINSDSFIELVADMGNYTYREVIRWDLAEKRFVTNAFGGAGGHGAFAWFKSGEKTWKLSGKTPYYWSSGEAVEVDLTLTSVDKDTMKLVGSVGDTTMGNTARRRKAMSEPASSRDWRKFWLGDWHRVTEWTVNGKTTKSEYDYRCVAAGDANVGFNTDGAGYAIVYSWQPDRAALVETGHSSEADWEIVFKPDATDIMRAISTGRMRDGRRGVGTNVVKRTGPDSYTAEATIKLDDGSTAHVIDGNTRK